MCSSTAMGGISSSTQFLKYIYAQTTATSGHKGKTTCLLLLMHLFVLHEQPKSNRHHALTLHHHFGASYRYITTFISDDILAI